MQLSFGAGRIFGTRTDLANSTPIGAGIMQDAQIDFAGDIKALWGSNVFAEELARGKIKVTGKAKFARINANLFNSLYFGQPIAAGQVLASINEIGTVPAAVTYTVNAANGATFTNDLGVIYANTGVWLTKVAAAPAVGQYAVSALGVYTFAAADANAAVALNYEYTATTGFTISLNQQAMGTLPYFRADFTTTFNGKTLTLSLNRCGSSKLNLASKQDDFMIPELDFEAVANPLGSLGTLSLSE